LYHVLMAAAALLKASEATHSTLIEVQIKHERRVKGVTAADSACAVTGAHKRCGVLSKLNVTTAAAAADADAAAADNCG
jgi:hypothetical protein